LMELLQELNPTNKEPEDLLQGRMMRRFNKNYLIWDSLILTSPLKIIKSLLELNLCMNLINKCVTSFIVNLQKIRNTTN